MKTSNISAWTSSSHDTCGISQSQSGVAAILGLTLRWDTWSTWRHLRVSSILFLYGCDTFAASILPLEWQNKFLHFSAFGNVCTACLCLQTHYFITSPHRLLSHFNCLLFAIFFISNILSAPRKIWSSSIYTCELAGNVQVSCILYNSTNSEVFTYARTWDRFS